MDYLPIKVDLTYFKTNKLIIMYSMKRLLIPAILMSMAFSFVAAQSDVSIVTVSMQRLFDGYYKATEANARLESIRQRAFEEAEEKQLGIQAKAEQLESIQEDMENPMLSETARGQKQEELQRVVNEGRQMQSEYQQWEQQTMENLNRQSQQIRDDLIGEIRKVVDVVGREKGAQMLLDTSDILGSGVPTVLWADPRLDITDEVMRELNRNAPNN